MSQVNTYQVPPHPTGLDMRVQLNAIVLALLGDNCGPDEPIEKYPCMWWGDTTANRLRHRTNANDGWIDVGPLDDPLAELRNPIPRGTITMWWGDATYVPAGWVICDGNNGTPDMRDRFPMGAGLSYGLGGQAGVNWQTLTYDQMPWHQHGIWDPGHGHGYGDPGHGHGVSDPSHNHGNPDGGWAQAGQDNGGTTAISGPNQYGGRGAQATWGNGTGIGIYGNGTGCWIDGNGTGIGINAAGNGQAFDNRPAATALWFLMKL